MYIYTYIYSSGESKHGTRFGGLGVKQRDAPPLNNGTRLILHYKNRGSGFFPHIPMSDRWVENVIESLDPDFQHRVFALVVFKILKLKFVVFDFRDVIFVSV